MESENFYPIPSEPREPGWAKFLEMLPNLLEHNRGTARELRLLHRLRTTGVALPPWPDSIELEAAERLLCQGRELDQIMAVQVAISKGIFTAAAACAGTIVPNTKAAIALTRRGHVRKFGKRIVDDRPPEIVHASHCKPFYGDNGGELLHVGLAQGLQELFDKLCTRYDQLQKDHQGADLDTKLRVLVFLQLWGAAVLHPFFDGNGRAFNAKLVLDLNRLGFKVQKSPELVELNPELSTGIFEIAGPMFTKAFLCHNSIGLVDPNGLYDFFSNPDVYNQYMDKMREGIKTGIGYGLSPSHNTPYGGFFYQCTEILKVYLSKEGFLNRSIYDAVKAEVFPTELIPGS